MSAFNRPGTTMYYINPTFNKPDVELKKKSKGNTLAGPGFEVRGEGRGSSGIHKSQRAQANSWDKQKKERK